MKHKILCSLATFILFMSFSLSLGKLFGKVEAIETINIEQPCNLVDGAFDITNNEYNININKAHWNSGETGSVDIGANYAQPIAGNSYQRCKDNIAIASINGTVHKGYSGFFSCSALGGQIVQNTELTITGDNGVKVRYLHMNFNASNTIADGPVQAGQVLGTIGSVGCSTFNHIHLDVYKDNVYVANNNDWKFVPDISPAPTYPQIYFTSGNYDTDALADISIKDNNTGEWKIDYAANGYGNWDKIYPNWGGGSARAIPGDYDGDHKLDLAIRIDTDGHLLIDYSSDGLGEATKDVDLMNFGDHNLVPFVGDFNGGGKDDVAMKSNTGTVLIDYAEVNGFGAWNFTGETYGNETIIPIPGKFDSDNKTDLGFKSNGGTLLVDNSSDGFDQNANGWDYNINNYGDETLVPFVGDFDGNGKDDIAVKSATGTIKFDYSENGFSQYERTLEGYGNANFVPIPADYDGDGKDDIAISQDNLAYFIDYQKNGFNGWDAYIYGYGGTETTPTMGDYDGDGLTDLSVKSTSGYWYIDYAKNKYGAFDKVLGGWGDATSKPIPGDFDGDGKTDIAVKQDDGTLKIDYTGTGGLRGTADFTKTGFGNAGWYPFVGDFDGDHLDDIAVKSDGGFIKINFKKDGFTDAWDKTIEGYGNASAIPYAGDFNGGGKDDILVKTASGTLIVNYSESTTGDGLIQGIDFRINGYGDGTSRVIIGDFNGNGKDDVIVKTNGGTLIINYSESSNGDGLKQGENTRLEGYGDVSLIPFAGKFNSGLRTDLGVKSSTGTVLLDYLENGFGKGTWDLRKEAYIPGAFGI